MARPQSRRQSRNNHTEDVLIAPPGSPTRWSTEQNGQVFSPSPPSKPPAGESKRKSSARRRVSTISNDPSQSMVSGDFDPFARRPSRPSSSLSKYKPLPDITPSKQSDTTSVGTVETVQSKHSHVKTKVQKTTSSETKVKHLSDKKVKESNSEVPISRASSNLKKDTFKVSCVSKKIKNVAETVDVDKMSVIEIGVRLPDTGDRVCQSFRPSDTMNSVMKFAQEKTGNKKLSQNYDLAINMPRKVFKNLKMTIREAGLENKTILYLVDKDVD